MKNIIALFSIVTIIASCDSSQVKTTITDDSENIEQSSDNEINENIFSNEKLKISFSYPKNWEVQCDTINKLIQVLSYSSLEDEFKEMIMILIGESDGMDLTGVFNLNMQYVAKTFDEFSITEEPQEIEIEGRKYKSVKYNYVQGYPLTNHNFVTLQNSDVYAISCIALQNTFDQYQDQFMSVVNSIVID